MAQARIRTVLDLESSRFEVGLKRAAVVAGTFADKLRGIGGLIGVSFGLAGTKALIEWAGDLADVARQASISTDALQALTAAGLRNNASQEEIVGMLQRLKKSQGEVTELNKEQTAAWDRLGQSAKNVVGTDTIGLLEVMAKRLKDGGYNSADMAAATDILGKSMQNLLPLIGEIADVGMQRLIDQTSKVSEATIAMAEQWDNSLKGMVMKAKAWSMEAIAFIRDVFRFSGGAEGRRLEIAAQEDAAKINAGAAAWRAQQVARRAGTTAEQQKLAANQAEAAQKAADKERLADKTKRDAAADRYENEIQRAIEDAFRSATEKGPAASGLFSGGRGDYLRSIGAGGAVAGDPIQRELLQIAREDKRTQEEQSQLLRGIIETFRGGQPGPNDIRILD